jgi:hypothetical protein
LGGQSGQNIEIFVVFWGMHLETLFFGVNYCMIFVNIDGEKHMECSLFFNMLFHHLFAKFAVFRNARNLKTSDFSSRKCIFL